MGFLQTSVKKKKQNRNKMKINDVVYFYSN